MSVAHEPGASGGASRIQPMSIAQSRRKGEVLLAYNLKGHHKLSKQAIDKVLDELPEDLAWMRKFLADTPQSTVHRDVADVLTFAHWRAAGQKHHFMRDESQSLMQAYNAGAKWIHDNALRAARNLRKRFKTKGIQRGRAPVPTHQVNGPLGNAFHALQDSFAEGHVTRSLVGLRYVITEIHVYDDANQEARPGWEGHSALDKNWDSPLAATAVLGCQVLTKNVIAASMEESPMRLDSVWQHSWIPFKSNFLAITAKV